MVVLANAGEPAAEEPFLRTPSCPDVLRFCSLCLRFLSVGTSFKSIIGLSIRNTWDQGASSCSPQNPAEGPPERLPGGPMGRGRRGLVPPSFGGVCFTPASPPPKELRTGGGREHVDSVCTCAYGCIWVCARVCLNLKSSLHPPQIKAKWLSAKVRGTFSAFPSGPGTTRAVPMGDADMGDRRQSEW